MSKTESIPTHVAIIMDGNGRWARRQGKERMYGHSAGVESVRRVIKAAAARGVSYLTLYTFSKENWGRPQAEVDALMELFCTCVISETEELRRERTTIRVVGDRASLSPKVQEHLERIETQTAVGDRLTVLLAINYSARWDIAQAALTLAEQVAAGTLAPEAIDEAMIGANLATAPAPDPDLLIRTGGELRLSNFLLWQCAYTEFYFTDMLWPDFGAEEFDKALEWYAGRQRKFGLVTE